MRIFCAFLIFGLSPPGSNASREVLLDTSTSSTDLRWEQLSLKSDRDDAWTEETWASSAGTNERAYVTCSYSEANPINWLFTPVVQTRKANLMYLELLFNTRECADYIDPKSCKETFSVYVKQYEHIHPTSDIHRQTFNRSLHEWSKIAVLSKKNANYTEETLSVKINDRTKAIRFGFEENGLCLSLLRVKIYYVMCDATVIKFSSLPQTVTGSDRTEPVTVTATCTENAVSKQSEAPVGFCSSSGKWNHVVGECECKGGYESEVAMGRQTCTECPTGTFKPGKGEGRCQKCPENSYANSVASEKCECRQGWYRAEEDLPNSSCTKAPGRPSLVEHYNLGQNSVTLRWNEPVDLGGRHEVWYEWECTRGECATIKPSPADKRLHSRTLVLSGLEPDTDYSFNIYAKNKVSDLSEAASYKSVDFRTLPFTNYQVSGIRIDQVQGNGITVVWQQPAVAKRIREYEVEITPSVNGNEAKEIRLSNESHLNLYGLHSGVTYTFRIRVNVDGWGRWSSPVMYEVGKGQMISHKTEESSSSAVGHVPVWLIIVSVAALSLVFLSILIACRRQKRNRKQMSDLDVLDTYKQDTMTPDYNTNHRSALHPANGHVYRSAKLNAPLISYGSPISQPPPYYGAAALNNKYKPYVDPTAYEDPNQALSEFTFDIDPKAVFITQVIGGGEFGDVCRGGIRRSALSLSQGGVSNVIFENDIETVAIKTLKPGSSAKAKGEFLVEASIMGQFSHPNVIRLIGVVTRSEPAMIVTEYMANGSLDHFLRGRDARNEDISWTRIADMLRGIAAGMKYLTDKGFVHRDLAARNVLVDAELTCKIADFGLSRGVDDSVDQEYTTNGGKIPVRWTSPEAITHRKFTASSDVWSFGVVIWEVCSFGERPYWDWTNQKVISEVMLGYRLPAPLDCPPSLHRLAQWCWRLDRHERPSFAQLLSILEKYVNSPTLLESDPGMLPRHAVSSINISTPPVPPSSNPPIYPSLVEFLRSLGMTHCLEKLQAADILTVEELSTRTHLDLLAIGLISEEWQRIRDAMQQLQRHQSTTNLARATRITPSTATLPNRGARKSDHQTGIHADRGFFV